MEDKKPAGAEDHRASAGKSVPPSNTSTPSEKTKGFIAQFIDKHFRHREKLDMGLDGLEAQLGLSKNKWAVQHSTDITLKRPTRELARPIFYAPDMDGQAEPGEIVWANLRFDKASPLEQRAVLLIGRNNHTLLGLLISSKAEHAEEHNWIAIGSGPWNDNQPDSWIRVDKTLLIPETYILRRGARMPERRFERIASRLRENYGWK